MTPPYNVIVYGTGEHLDAAIEASVSFLLREGVTPPGVIGPRGVASSFASTWSQCTSAALTVQMEQMIYRLDRVNDIPLSPGELICATGEHTDLVAGWMVSFSEVTHERLDRPEALNRAQEMIAASRVYLWFDGMPVSMAWRARPSRHGIVVTGVYTPPQLRTRGYATACVASLSQLLLDEGFQFCALYADLANPISNHIYQKMGYRPIQPSMVYGFEPS
jgi:predicted GNAT family acetyltransferase